MPKRRKPHRRQVKVRRNDNKSNRLVFKKKKVGSPDRRRGAGTR